MCHRNWWVKWLRAGEDAALVQTIRACTRTGRPAGGETFIARLEKLTRRRLRPKKAARPRKEKGKTKGKAKGKAKKVRGRAPGRKRNIIAFPELVRTRPYHSGKPYPEFHNLLLRPKIQSGTNYHSMVVIARVRLRSEPCLRLSNRSTFPITPANPPAKGT